jgi:hypothetical protein
MSPGRGRCDASLATSLPAGCRAKRARGSSGPVRTRAPGLVDGLGALGAGAALGDHQRADCLDGAVPALGGAAGPDGLGGPRGADGVEWVGLVLAALVLPVGAVHFDDPDGGCGDVPGQAGAVAAGALDPDQADGPEPAQPAPG